jgi:hypothetical protein
VNLIARDLRRDSAKGKKIKKLENSEKKKIPHEGRCCQNAEAAGKVSLASLNEIFVFIFNKNCRKMFYFNL